MTYNERGLLLSYGANGETEVTVRLSVVLSRLGIAQTSLALPSLLHRFVAEHRSRSSGTLQATQRHSAKDSTALCKRRNGALLWRNVFL